jgi:hypothetical protein
MHHAANIRWTTSLNELMRSVAGEMSVNRRLQSVPGYGLTVDRMDDVIASNWAPDVCTLPTEDRPLRRAEFDDLFATAVTDISRFSPTRARFGMSGGDVVADHVADLARREQSCCSFFVFEIERDGDRVVLDVRVPPAYAQVLTALVGRAEQVRQP